MRDYKDEAICDLAEYYSIYDIDSHPKNRVAILIKGLRMESRVMKKLTKITHTQQDLMLASILDNLNLLVWSKTKDAQKGKNKPSSLLSSMLGQEEKKEDVITFTSGKDFEKERQKMIKKLEKGGN